MIRWTKICTSLQFLSHVYGFEISFLLVFFYSFCYISLLLLLLHYFLPCITKRDGNSSSTIFFIEERPRDEKKKRKWLDLTSTPFLLSFPSTLFFSHKQLLDSVLLSLSLFPPPGTSSKKWPRRGMRVHLLPYCTIFCSTPSISLFCIRHRVLWVIFSGAILLKSVPQNLDTRSQIVSRKYILLFSFFLSKKSNGAVISLLRLQQTGHG